MTAGTWRNGAHRADGAGPPLAVVDDRPTHPASTSPSPMTRTAATQRRPRRRAPPAAWPPGRSAPTRVDADAMRATTRPGYVIPRAGAGRAFVGAGDRAPARTLGLSG